MVRPIRYFELHKRPLLLIDTGRCTNIVKESFGTVSESREGISESWGGISERSEASH